jgi:acyl-CoA synthetase (AMP-forming)/AMP-acid ligase II
MVMTFPARLQDAGEVAVVTAVRADAPGVHHHVRVQGQDLGHVAGREHSGGRPASSPTSRPALRSLQVYTPTTSVPGWSIMARSAALPIAPADHVPDKAFAHRLISTGRPMAGARVRVVGPVTLEDRPTGERGKVLVAGSRVMKGYWPKPDQTAEVILPDGWLRTGDGGSFDADGYLYLHGRLKDMLISGGENVYPAEVEMAVMRTAL